MRKLFVLGCLTVLVLSAGRSAKADDDFKGPYIGITFGDNVARSHARTSTVFSSTGYFAASSVPAIASTGAQHLNPEGFFGGGEVGYNFQFGKIFVGAEGDYSVMSTMSDRKSGTAVYPCCAQTSFTITQTLATDWLLTARPRVGFAMNHMLVYLTGGLAETHVKYNEHFTDTFASANEIAVLKQNLAGWTMGGGFEYKFGLHLSAKAEYLYAGFGQVAVTSTNLTAFPPVRTSFPTNVFTHSDDMHMHIARIGINYRF